MKQIQLSTDEKMLFQGIADSKKSNKQILRCIFAIPVLVLFWFLVINIIKTELSMESLILLLVLILLSSCFIYIILDRYFIKCKKYEYYITNQKLYILYSNKDAIIRNLKDISQIGIAQEKGQFGNLALTFDSENLFERIKHTVGLHGVKYPREIALQIKSIKDDVFIYDDKPKGIFFKNK